VQCKLIIETEVRIVWVYGDFSATLYIYDIDLLKMSRVKLETCGGF
jgi:hypothetical protein